MPVDCSPKSGSMFRIGETTVVCSSVDLDNNFGGSAFVVEVVGENGTPAAGAGPAEADLR